ncbi:hypothetical protein [Pelagibacterium xiamenense]|uniref:hypothetical protein n=1 Tax=Pelagibacterium xiamenense TaxID=2901140 RepID=UPI001E2A9194|nr:hypothetical protein [Pelagibacterium xiamenense]MCD7060283.1 hypothetical protein [Pelagibacterium xiamenense]
MIFMLYAALALVAVTVIGNLMLARWNAERREKRIGERVDAYLTSLEREGVPEPLEPMSAQERRDTLISAGHRVRVESDKRFYVVTIGAILGFFVALGFAIEGAGTRDFVITLAIAAVALYGVHAFLYRTFRARMAAQGIDIERLKIE